MEVGKSVVREREGALSETFQTGGLGRRPRAGSTAIDYHAKIEKNDWLQVVKALVEAKANVNARSIGFILLVCFLRRQVGRACPRAHKHARTGARALSPRTLTPTMT